MKWSHEEDYIVCSFYLSHLDNWKQHIDELMELLKQAGYGNRKRDSIIMRVHNYEYLHTGKGLANYARQSKAVYKSFISRTTKSVVYYLVFLAVYIKLAFLCFQMPFFLSRGPRPLVSVDLSLILTAYFFLHLI